MAEIDIGPDAVNRLSSTGSGYTNIFLTNPANDSGHLDTIEIWAYSAISEAKVGTFYGSGLSYTYRDHADIGTVTAGSKQTFSGLDIDVESGDYIAMYWSGGSLEATSSGGEYYKYGDYMTAGTNTFTSYTETGSVYGSGETAGAETSWGGTWGG